MGRGAGGDELRRRQSEGFGRPHSLPGLRSAPCSKPALRAEGRCRPPDRTGTGADSTTDRVSPGLSRMDPAPRRGCRASPARFQDPAPASARKRQPRPQKPVPKRQGSGAAANSAQKEGGAKPCSLPIKPLGKAQAIDLLSQGNRADGKAFFDTIVRPNDDYPLGPSIAFRKMKYIRITFDPCRQKLCQRDFGNAGRRFAGAWRALNADAFFPLDFRAAAARFTPPHRSPLRNFSTLWSKNQGKLEEKLIEKMVPRAGFALNPENSLSIKALRKVILFPRPNFSTIFSTQLRDYPEGNDIAANVRG